MALKTFVKISGVNNLSDARYCAGMEVSLLGFCVDPENPNFTTVEKYKEIKEWLAGVQYVLEFGNNTSAENIKSTIDEYGAELIEISNIQLIEGLKDIAIEKILKLNIKEVHLAEGYEDDITYLLVENDHDTFTANHLDILSRLSSKFKIILGFGITTENIGDLIGHTAITGIALKGGDEIKPGLKDFDELADILEALEIDDLA